MRESRGRRETRIHRRASVRQMPREGWDLTRLTNRGLGLGLAVDTDKCSGYCASWSRLHQHMQCTLAAMFDHTTYN
jgi:hypothetical protein